MDDCIMCEKPQYAAKLCKRHYDLEFQKNRKEILRLI